MYRQDGKKNEKGRPADGLADGLRDGNRGGSNRGSGIRWR